jgi:lipopolysaccharide transport system permease protein
VTGDWEITATEPGLRVVLADVWRHRHLVNYIGGRALRKMYRKTVLGWLWLFINPLFPLALRSLIFGALLGVGSNGVPYFLFLLCGTIIWDAFAVSWTWGTRALEMNRGVTDQVYAPRVLMPLGNLTPALLEIAIKTAVFALAVVYYAVHDHHLYLQLGVHTLWAAAALLCVLLLAVGLSYFTSVWGETGRDARFALGQILAVWYLLTPVLFPLSELQPAHRAWALLNPLTVMVETFKWGLFGIGEFLPVPFAVTAALTAAIVALGLLYFSRSEARALDAQ